MSEHVRVYMRQSVIFGKAVQKSSNRIGTDTTAVSLHGIEHSIRFIIPLTTEALSFLEIECTVFSEHIHDSGMC